MSRFIEDFSKARRDLAEAIANYEVPIALGWNDVKSRYNRSRFGVFWASLSMLIFVGALGPIYASLLGVELREYVIHLLLGLIIWNYVSSLIMECGREYINSASYLVSFQLSYFSLLFRVVWRNFVVLSYQLLIFILFVLILNQPIKIAWLMAPIALIFITLNALWMGLLMSVFATRFRDLSELMNNILRLMFFVTPIMWMPNLKGDLSLVADLNPFYHLIEIFRSPLQSGDIQMNSLIVAFVMLCVGWLIAFPIFARFRSRISFWI